MFQCSIIQNVPLLDYTGCSSACLYSCPSITETCVVPISCYVGDIVAVYYLPKPLVHVLQVLLLIQMILNTHLN